MQLSSDTQRKHPRKPFSQEEDQILIQLVQSYHNLEVDWKDISFKMKDRSIRQCKERWEKYLNPNLSVDPWTPEEDDIIINMFYEFGPKWTLIANMLEKRTDIMVRNRWNVINRKALKCHKKKKQDKKKKTNKRNKKIKNNNVQKEKKKICVANEKSAKENVNNENNILKIFDDAFEDDSMNEINQYIQMNFDIFF